jgi:2,5-diketo-D-gluconate reductase B
LYVHALYPGTDMAEYLPAMNELVDEGLIRGIGLSNVTLEQLWMAEKLSRHPIVAVQNLYGPLYHHDGRGNKPTFGPEFMAYCRAKGIAMVAHTPLHMGTIATDAKLRHIAQSFGMSPVTMALAWVIHHGVIPIPHFGEEDFVEENLAAARTRLTAGGIHQLDHLEPRPIPARDVLVPA